MLIVIIVLEMGILAWLVFYANYIIKSVNESVDESLAELMNMMLHIDELREKVNEAVKNGQKEVDMTEVLK